MVNSLEGGGTETIGHTPMIEECRRVSTRGRGQVKGTELTSRQSETLEIIRRHIKIGASRHRARSSLPRWE